MPATLIATIWWCCWQMTVLPVIFSITSAVAVIFIRSEVGDDDGLEGRR
jgi:hypothetical protein